MEHITEEITQAKKAKIEQFCLELIDRLLELEANCMFDPEAYKLPFEKRLKELYEILGEPHKAPTQQKR